jgi:hypothetical protein
MGMVMGLFMVTHRSSVSAGLPPGMVMKENEAAASTGCGCFLTLIQKIHIIQWNYYEITAGKDYG